MFRKGRELCTCGVGRGVHVCRKGYECVHVYSKGCVYMCVGGRGV